MNVLQDVRCGDVGHVERRILSHEHHVQVGEVEHFRFAQPEMVTAYPLHPQRRGARRHLPPEKVRSCGR